MIKTLFLLLMLPIVLFAEDRAYTLYKQGEHATSPEERKEAFNDALTLYLQQDSDRASAELDYNIANTYFQLSEYGYAILYYYKALKVNPRFDEARINLQIAQEKVGRTPDSPNFVQNYLLFFHYKLSHNEKAVIVLFLLFFAFAFLSVNLWLPQVVLKKVATIALWIAVAFTISIVWSDYFTNPEAVIVRPVALRRDAGDQYAPVVGTPLLSGTKVVVLSVDADGNWLKVRSENEEGYISKEYARII